MKMHKVTKAIFIIATLFSLQPVANAAIITFDYRFSVESFSASPDFDLITDGLRAADTANNSDGFITGTISIDDTPGANPLHIGEMVNVPPNYFNPNAIINMDVLAGKLNSVIWSFDWGLVIGSHLSTQWTLTLTSDSVSAYCLQYVLVNDGPPLTCNDEIGSGGDFRYGVSQMSAGASVKLRQSQVVNNVPAPASLLLFGLVLPLFFNLRRRASTEPFRYRKWPI